MATIKICVLDCTHWITDVKGVRLLRSFGIPDEASDTEVDALAFAFAGDHGPPPKSYSIANFDGQGVNRFGNVLSIDKAGESETWLVPAGACFLMSDAGKTIDRI